MWKQSKRVGWEWGDVVGSLVPQMEKKVVIYQLRLKKQVPESPTPICYNQSVVEKPLL